MERKGNYDLLKILCAIAVISMHVSGFYVDSYNNIDSFSILYTKNIDITCIFFTFSRFAVPCFCMLAGAFALSNKKNVDCKFYYKKIFKSIIIPTILFSLVYFIYSCIIKIPIFIEQNNDWSVFIYPLEKLLCGEPFYHMWYMFMIIPIYLCVPFIIQLKEKYKDYYHRFAIVFLILCAVSATTTTWNINYSISASSCYLGYFIIGNVIYEKFLEKKDKRKSLLCFLISFIVLFVLYFLILNKGVIENNQSLLDYLVNPYNPLILVAFIYIFIGVSMIDVKVNLIKVASKLIYIYMIHALVWDITSRVIRKIWGINGNNVIIIPVSIIIVFVISLLLSHIYCFIYKAIQNSTGVNKYNCNN